MVVKGSRDRRATDAVGGWPHYLIYLLQPLPYYLMGCVDVRAAPHW